MEGIIIKNKLFFLLSLFLITSCGGGGGGGSPSLPFSISVSSFSISVDEDDSFSGNLSATKNETATVTFEVTTSPTNGTLSLNSNGSYIYRPSANFNGSDSFKYRAYATPQNKYSTEATATITVNAIDDPPVLTLNNLADENSILFRDDQGNISFSGSVSDIDNDFADLTFSSTFNGQDVSLIVDNETGLTISIDVSSIIDASRFNVEIKACSGEESSPSCDSEAFDTYLASGFNDDGTYITYNILGSYELGSTNPRNIAVMILADSIYGSSSGTNRSAFREQLTKNLNALMDGTIKEYVDGFFNIMVVEPSSPDGSSFVDVKSGDDCEEDDDDDSFVGTAICFDNEKLLALEEALYPNEFFDITNMMTAVEARYYAIGGTFFSGIGGSLSDQTFLHELGHAHALLDDEYESPDDRDQDYALYSISSAPNVTDDSDPNNAQWKHLINDLTNIPGYHQTAGIDGVGFFEGIYWKEEGGFRPQVDSIMNQGSRCEETNACPNGETLQYRKSLTDFTNQHAESFVIRSISQLIDSPFDGGTFQTSESGTRTALNISSGIFDERALDNTKFRLDWYVNGVKDSSLTDTNSVAFDRPAQDKWEIYSWTLSDKTGLAIADDPLDTTDAYGADIDYYAISPYTDGPYEEDYFYARLIDTSGDGRWIDRPLTVDEIEEKYPEDSYLYFYTPMGGTLALNWRKW